MKAAAAIGSAAVIAGCVTTTSKSQAEIQAQYPRKVTFHTSESIQRAAQSERAFALISKRDGSDSWELISVTTRFPKTAAGQEVFRVSDDLLAWEIVVPRVKDCSKHDARYSVCYSQLATKDWLGYANYDTEAAIKAVNSIPEVQATAVMQHYLEAEDASAMSIYEAKRKQQAECYRQHDAGTHEIEAAGGKAMSAAIAGKLLTNEEMAAIRRTQLRMSSSSVCGFNTQPPKKRAAK